MKKLLASFLALSLLNNGVQAQSSEDFGDELFEKKVLEVIMKNPEVIEKSLELYADKRRKEQEEKQLEEALTNRYELKFGDSPVLGKKDAKYKLFVFTDFQCPYCKRADETIRALKEKYSKDMVIVHKNYPLGFHENAKPAAKAAIAASMQNKFFEYSELLFENQRRLGEELYLKLAKDLNLDIEEFKKDMKSKKVEEQLEKDIQEASEVKVGSTPNLFLNGVKVAGAYPIEYFEKIISKLNETK